MADNLENTFRTVRGLESPANIWGERGRGMFRSEMLEAKLSQMFSTEPAISPAGVVDNLMTYILRQKKKKKKSKSSSRVGEMRNKSLAVSPPAWSQCSEAAQQ